MVAAVSVANPAGNAGATVGARISNPGSRRRVFLGRSDCVELLEALDSFFAEGRRMSSNGGFARLLDAWEPSVQGCNQLAELTRKIACTIRECVERAHRVLR